MPLHTPYCAESDFCVCWTEPHVRGLKPRKEAAIAVVGAGLAGLSAADQLINRYGFKNVVVYEALDRVGGRAHTVKFGDGHVELGALYVHNLPNSVVLKMAQDLGLVPKPAKKSLLGIMHRGAKLNFRRRPTDISLRQGGASVDSELVRSIRQLLLATELDAAKGRLKLGANFPAHVCKSLGAVQTHAYNEWRLKNKRRFNSEQIRDLDLLFKFAVRAAEFDYGCEDWNDVSLASTSHFYTLSDVQADLQPVALDGQGCSRATGGYGTLVAHLLGALPMGTVRLKTTVTCLDWSGPRVELQLSDGTSDTVDHALVTVPLAVLKRRALTLFSPPLPSVKMLAMEGMGVGSVEKVFAKFDKCFWKKTMQRYELLWAEPSEEESEEGRLARAFFVLQPVTTSSNVVCLWTSGKIIKDICKITETMLKNVVKQIILSFFPAVDETLAYPLSVLRSNWTNARYFGGAYSFYSLAFDAHGQGPAQLAEPLYADDGEAPRRTPTPLVLFAGEATCVHSYGTTHGAVVSGHHEARRLHLFYKRRECQVSPTTACYSSSSDDDSGFTSCFGAGLLPGMSATKK